MPIIGVALALPEPWAGQLQDYRVSLGDECAARIPTHITLLPPTEVPGSLDDVVAHLAVASRAVPAFRVHLRGTGTFRPVSPVVFVNLVRGIGQCEVLAEAVRSGPLAAEPAFPYHPHVTVAHDLSADLLDRAFAELADFECEFEAAAFNLYGHDDASGWRPTHEFTLPARAVAAG